MTSKKQRSFFVQRFGRWLFIPPLLVGIVVAVLIVKNRQQPKRESAKEQRRMLRVIEVPVVDVTPRVIGYGTATPGQTWRAVPQVSGRVVEVHSELRSGSIVKKEGLLLKIDPAKYQFAVAQLEAEIRQATALVDEMTRTEENYKASLAIEEKTLVIAQRELGRLKDLAQRNVTSQADLDAQERTVLGQTQRIQEQTNLLNLLPTRKQSQQANLALKQAQLAQAKLDLEHTDIQAPFDCRLGEVELELDQYVVAGEKLFEAYSIDLVEVEAQVLPSDVRRLFQQSEAPVFVAGISMERVREIFKVEATVEMASADIPVRWPAQFMRVRESIDPQTRTIGLVVGVEKPYDNVIPGQRPPLLAGTYCRVTFAGPTRKRQVIIPRSAIRDGHVFVLDAENRLHRKAVRVDFEQDAFAVIRAGLAGGETLVVSDPTPGIEGMLVEPLPDHALLERLIHEAQPAAKAGNTILSNGVSDELIDTPGDGVSR